MNELTKPMDMAEIAKTARKSDEELAEQAKEIPYAPLQLKIKHERVDGDHKFYLKVGDTSQWLGDTIDIITVYYDPVRSWFKEDGLTAPTCAAVRKVPTVSNPVCESCFACPKAEWTPMLEGEKDEPPVCKESIRLFVAIKNPDGSDEWLNAIAYLSQTNIKPWHNFIRHIQLHDVVACRVLTRVTLVDTKKGSFRYAVTNFTPIVALTDEQNDLVDLWRIQVRSFLKSGGERDLAEGKVWESDEESKGERYDYTDKDAPPESSR